MAEETSRPLTVEEVNKPILDITGEQALMGADTVNTEGATVPGQFDLGKAQFTPEQMTVASDQELDTTGKTLTSDSLQSTPDVAAQTAAIVPPEAKDAASIDNIERTYSSLPTTTAQQGSVQVGEELIDLNQVVDERTKAQMLERGSLAEAKTQTLALEATTKYQVEQLMASLDSDAELPAWAAPNVRKVRSIMNQRGLGSSSMAAAAMVQALQESALPIANADAQTYAKLQLVNLSNEQQTSLQNAATIAAMDKQNLDNRMKASQQNATSYLQLELQNLTNRQASETLNHQSKIQSLFTDQAAANAAKQFNATSQNQVNQFYDTLGTTVANNNANREAAINEFNVDQTNAMKKYNAKLEDSRERFNSNLQMVVDQSNTVWRRNVNTANTAAQNAANQINSQTILGLSVQAQNNLWQKYRDEASMAFSSAQNAQQRAHAIAITAIANQFTSDMFNRQVDVDSNKMIGRGLSSLLGKVVDVGLGAFTFKSSDSSGGFSLLGEEESFSYEDAFADYDYDPNQFIDQVDTFSEMDHTKIDWWE